jgi:hypothetical protein
LLFFRIGRSDSHIELLDPGCTCSERGRLVFGERNFEQPAVKVFFVELVDVGMTIDFDEVSHLEYVDTIKHVKETLTLKWY